MSDANKHFIHTLDTANLLQSRVYTAAHFAVKDGKSLRKDEKVRAISLSPAPIHETLHNLPNISRILY